jgi:hypothetical protein
MDDIRFHLDFMVMMLNGRTKDATEASASFTT